MGVKLFVLLIVLSFDLAWASVFKADSDFKPVVKESYFKKKGPVVLMDQGHLNLAATDGRYAPITHLLESDGFKVLPIGEVITSELLLKGQILYISGAQGVHDSKKKSVTQPAFTKKETEVIQQWVRGGGALLLMADHDLIGNAVHTLAQKFDVEVSNGVVNDPQNYLPNLNDQSHLLFTDENQLIAKHPIIRGRNDSERIHKVAAFAGQSVRGPKNSQVVLKLAPSAINYFRDETKTPIQAGFTEAIAFHYGKGRVVVFGDGTVFTSKINIEKNEKEGMNRTDIDNVKLATNTFRWLAGVLGP